MAKFSKKLKHRSFHFELIAIALLCLGAIPIPSNMRVTGHLSGIQNEEQVWICPSDSNVIITNHRDFRLGYRQIGIGRSIDGGISWQDQLVPKSQQKLKLQSDPGMVITSAGTIVTSHLDYQVSGGILDSSYISILTSDDCGATWAGPYTVEDTIGPYFEDKPFITSDRTGGPRDGTLYVSWTRVSPYMRRIMFSRSEDGVNWADPIVIGPPHSSICYDSVGPFGFSQPLVGRDGAVYVFWIGVFDFPPPSCTFANTLDFNKSTDGGATWGSPRILSSAIAAAIVDGGIQASNEPITCADISDGAHAGNLYLEYLDNESSGAFDTGIWFRRSLDTGHTWSPPYRVNDDSIGPDVNQFHNWMVCNEEGVLVSIWYDQRTDPNQVKFDVFAAYSYDGGATWTSNHRISSVSIDPGLLELNAEPASSLPTSVGAGSILSPNAPLAGKIAEYIGLACSHDKVVSVWTDTRDGDQDVWSANWYLPLTEPRLLTNSGVTLTCGDTLKWATAWKENEDRYLFQASVTPVFAENELVLSGFTFANAFEIPPGLPFDTLYWRIKAYRAPYGVSIDSTTFSAVPWFRYTDCPCVCDCHRDPICDGAADIIDIVGVVDAAFNNANPSGDPSPSCPYIRTDVDCSNFTDVIDVVLIVNVVYRHGAFAGLCGTCD